MIILMLAIICLGLSSTSLMGRGEVSKSSQATTSEEAAAPESPVSVGSVLCVRRKHWQLVYWPISLLSDGRAHRNSALSIAITLERFYFVFTEKIGVKKLNVRCQC